MACVYILYSNSIDNYYIGSCKEIKNRLEQHRGNQFETGFTKRADDWNVYFLIENLKYQQARNIEQHIKKINPTIKIIVRSIKASECTYET